MQGWGGKGRVGVTIVLLGVISVMVIGAIATIMVDDVGLYATVRVMSTAVDYLTLK